MSELNELARDIPTWQDLPFGGRDEYVKLDANAAHAVASVLIGKGWRKPRTVTTAQDLIDLPDGSIILHPDGTSARKKDGVWRGDVDWYKPGPFTVLHEGGQDA